MKRTDGTSITSQCRIIGYVVVTIAPNVAVIQVNKKASCWKLPIVMTLAAVSNGVGLLSRTRVSKA